MNVGLVILAAGESSRMGTPKQLLPIFGKSMLKYLIEEAFETKCVPVTVVLGAHKSKIVPELHNMPISIIDNANWATGMGSSIKMGLIGVYMVEKSIDAVIFMTSDMPFVNAEVINKMIQIADEHPEKSIVAAKYGGTVGIPALFKRAVFEQLLDIKPKAGAKSIIQANKKDTISFNFDLGSVDLDTKQDYFEFLQSKN